MKKIFTLILGLSTGASAFAQNGSGNLHIFNDNTNHSLNLSYTIFTTTVNCASGMQALSPSTVLPPGGFTTYTTFAASTSTSNPPHPYPIDLWSGGAANQIPPVVATVSRWHYIKFSLSDPNNPSPMIPTLGGSIGFFQNCNPSMPTILDVNSSANGVNYTLHAEAVTFGGDMWITTQ